MSVSRLAWKKISVVLQNLRAGSFHREFRDFEDPVRSEIFSEVRLQTHAHSLAQSHQLLPPGSGGTSLIPRIRENRSRLEQCYAAILQTVEEKKAITPAAEWVADNFHIIRALLKDVHDHLPHKYYNELPKLKSGHLAGFPRVYGLAWAFVSHTDSRFDPDQLKLFLKSYQEVHPLSIGELWAVPITLRLVLIENLRRLSVRIVGSQIARKKADFIADEILGLAQTPSRHVDKIVDSLPGESFLTSFAVQLLQRLRFQEAKAEPILQWIESRLATENLTSDEIIALEHSSQTSANATVRNVITSARVMGSFNWQDFFEEVSLVDQTLRQNALYAQLDFATRNRYRDAIEELAKHSGCAETVIAQQVMQKTLSAPGTEPRARDLGFYLISGGRPEIEKEIDFKIPWRLRLTRFYRGHGLVVYLAAIAGLTGALLGLSALWDFTDVWYWIFAFVLLGLIPASEVAITLVNRWTIGFLGPKHLPRFSLEDGIPESLRTFVVVPTMLTDVEKIESQVEDLEIHYLSNLDDNLYFALLTDGADAQVETTPLDDRLLARVEEKIEHLNTKYPPPRGGPPRFYFFHRRRRFNPQEGCWMGWERKRGKLHEFNRLLLGAKDTNFFSLKNSLPSDIRFVITLDADTRTPNGSAAQLIGTLAHPLNEAFWDPHLKRVTTGYGVLQPRITPTLPFTHESTIYQRISTADAGIDPYASAVSDIYQDLFSKGSFAGKGIYDVQIFENAMAGQVPENSILSHDLFEGNLVRCGFLSDVEFFEDFPSQTEVAFARTHRWIRGDWQLLPWVLGRGGTAISPLGRWKMLDNFRRSLLAPVSLVLIAFVFLIPEFPRAYWLSLVFLGLCIHSLTGLVTEIFFPHPQKELWDYLQGTWRDFNRFVAQLAVTMALLVRQSGVHIDAILRVCYRMLISRQKMLEWTTAAQAAASTRVNAKSYLRKYRNSLLVTALHMVLVIWLNTAVWFWALPLWILWLAAPALALRISLPPKPRLTRPLSRTDKMYLRAVGRRIWYFFSVFVTKKDHYLPPDNFQETPDPVVAHRSSPTNFGLYLLSTMSARDFGWIGTQEMSSRLTETLASLSALPKHQGHFYNWYETQEFRPLEPKYISAVDNGNLAGHLLTVAQGCRQVLNEPLPWHVLREGLQDGLTLIEEAMGDTEDPRRPLLKELQEDFQEVDRFQVLPLSRWKRIYQQRLADVPVGPGDDVDVWLGVVRETFLSAFRDFESLFPWTDVATPNSSQHDLDEIQERLSLSFRLPLGDLGHHYEVLAFDLSRLRRQTGSEGWRENVDRLLAALELAKKNVNQLLAQLMENHQTCLRLFHEMDFGLLYDPARGLFSIGYQVHDEKLDASFYDLLASEARLTSYIAIAKGDVPASHWFHLGRGLTRTKNNFILVSWSGSMFEFLMPSLVMKGPETSIIERTCRLAVQRQIDYGRERGVPWGISESAYNKRDIHLTYQYSNFGVPDLGLKRGLSANLVVAPYATLLASMYAPQEAIDNLRELEKIGAKGIYGFYEAIDFTPPRWASGEEPPVVKTYMAHHQGMSLVAINNVFKNAIVRERFHAEPMVKATELLLQERMPRNATVSKPEENSRIDLVREEVEHVSRQYHTVNRPVPTTHLLSNGNYSVMLTSAGSGWSRYGEKAITRWREDVTCDDWGYFFYLRDTETDQIWSAGYQPTCVEPDEYEVTFFEDRAKFYRKDYGIVSELEVFVSPEDQAEIRRLTLTNQSLVEREIEVTSYFEVVINSQLADQAHPSFSNLFVQTEFHPDLQALVAQRRPRSSSEKNLWMALHLQTDSHVSAPLQYETDREKFLGRGKTVRRPQAVFGGQNLSDTAGAVLDPVFSFRTKLRLKPGSSSHLTYSTLLGFSREEVTGLCDKFRSPTIYDRVAGLAWTQGQVKLHFFNMEPDEAHLYQRLATRLIYLDSSLRPSSEIIKRNTKDVTGLWTMGISGDEPIVLVRIDDFEDRDIVRQLLKAHDYLGHRGLPFDLVILNDQGTSYAQTLQDSLQSLIHSRHALPGSPPGRGKVFVQMSSHLQEEDRVLLFASSRVVVSARQGSLSEQIKRSRLVVDPYSFPADKFPARREGSDSQLPMPRLKFFNGLGGFSEDQQEYVVVLKESLTTPRPWINVISNSHFGFQISESGSGYTWAYNSRENQITPWLNDPVGDSSGEGFYILDLDSNALWSPTALPIRVPQASYICHHGPGYSRFEHLSHGIYSELTQFVPLDETVKISELVLENRSRQQRRLAIFSYVEWVLGFSRGIQGPTTVTEWDASVQAIFARNPRSNEFGSNISFMACQQSDLSWTTDRSEFLGRNGSATSPGGVFREQGFSGKVGANLDACGALRKEIELAPGEKILIVFYLGQTHSREEARKILNALRPREGQLMEVKKYWTRVLSKVQVETPDPAMDLMLNRFLLYQTLACRFWARAAFYQAGGAFGFRDQLQDIMALMLVEPQMCREHILRAASRQFVEGDVQHWWHPPQGRGVRTHFSDDLLWLPYVVDHYLKTTQDFSILDVEVSFLEGPPLRSDQEDSYYTPMVSHNSASLYEHCVRALQRSLKTGVHGLPLMGCGDWNDGMNRVGHGGQGESVWLAWFLYVNLLNFADVAQERGDLEKAQTWRDHALKLKANAEIHAWDGQWYLRAFYDDGTPLGSASEMECQIDSLSQSWAVLSGAADPDRAKLSMKAVEKYLIRPEHKVLLLFSPPFDKTLQDPGYIKGYLPGVRENGGQYTHAAAWCVMAWAHLNEGKKATELFSLLNPINHARNIQGAKKYKVEPYVVAADVYGREPYLGQGGWTWYTGSCGWMYRAGMESILGLRIQGHEMHLRPCIPPLWKEYKIVYRYSPKTVYEIFVRNASEAFGVVESIHLDDQKLEGLGPIKMADDGRSHRVQVVLGPIHVDFARNS